MAVAPGLTAGCVPPQTTDLRRVYQEAEGSKGTRGEPPAAHPPPTHRLTLCPEAPPPHPGSPLLSPDAKEVHSSLTKSVELTAGRYTARKNNHSDYQSYEWIP